MRELVCVRIPSSWICLEGSGRGLSGTEKLSGHSSPQKPQEAKEDPQRARMIDTRLIENTRERKFLELE